ncbi:hypothetical protein GCM10028775_24280 [Catellatospora paridis]
MGERLGGDLEQPLAVALRVGAQWPVHGSSFRPVVTQLIVRAGGAVAKRRILRLAWRA